MFTQAMVLAAGYGKRMQPLTQTTPKPLVPLNNKPLIAYNLDTLERNGIKQVVVNTHHLAEQVEDYLAAYQADHPALWIATSFEPTLLETGGGIKNALPLFKDSPILAMNSDVICLDQPNHSFVQALYNAWDPEKMDILLMLYPTENMHGYKGSGDFIMAEDGSLTLRPEGYDHYPYVFTGVEVIHPRIFDLLPEDHNPIFSMNIFYGNNPDLTQPPAVYGMVYDTGEVFHVGTVEALDHVGNLLSNAA